MKLTDQQIQELYKFTRQHYVEWYDVQTELVDHLANDIEMIWQENPELTFEQAQDRSFKKFGIFGFMGVVEEKTKAMGKKYRKMVYEGIKEYFKLPKIIGILLLTYAFFLIIHNIEDKGNTVLIIMLLMVVLMLFLFSKTVFKIKNRQKKTKKKWMYEQTILQLGGIIQIPYILFQVLSFSKVRIPWDNFGVEIFTSVIVVLFLITIYVGMIKVPEIMRNKILEQHPEYNFVTNQ